MENNKWFNDRTDEAWHNQSGYTGDANCNVLQNGWCQKYSQAQASGNTAQIQTEIQNLATAYGITTQVAADLFTECCSDNSGGEPCPPADQNSPFYNVSNFCDSDYCNYGNNHPDCRCCDSGSSTGELDVSPWCNEYVQASESADFTGMQTIISAVTNTFGISWIQASQLLYDQCVCPDNGTGSTENDDCKDKKWLNMPTGTSSSGQKKNYCERCAGQSGVSSASQGNFPIDINGGTWQYNVSSGTNYCSCCGDTGVSELPLPCKYVASHGICRTYQAFVNNGDNQSAMQAVSTFANQESISVPEAYALVQKCCGDTNQSDILRYRCDAGGCLQCPPGTSASVCPHTESTCNNSCSTDPCEGFQDGGRYALRCCGKCDPYITPNHPCYDWCQQYGNCCSEPQGPTGGIQAMEGSSNNPIGMGRLQGQFNNFNGALNTFRKGDFLTDQPGYTQSMDEFINEIL
jgi:hypothetical protein